MPVAPHNDPEAWDSYRVFWGEQWWTAPGTATVLCPKAIGWDKKDASAQRGASISRVNEPLIEYTVRHELSDEEYEFGDILTDDFERWDGWEFVMARSYEDNSALDVDHPELLRQGVLAAVVTEIGPIQRNEDGGATVECKWAQWREPEPIGGVADSPENRTESDDEIDRLVKELDRVKKEGENL